MNARKSAVRAILKESKVVVLLWFAKDTLMLLFVGAPPAPSATCYVGGHPSLRWTSYHRLRCSKTLRLFLAHRFRRPPSAAIFLLSWRTSHFPPLDPQIPHNLGALTKLEVLDLSNNCFDGSLPPSMESMQLLNTFSASNNELSGELPPFLGSLTLLTFLALNGNQFDGCVPRELGKLTLLKRLYLENNNLVSRRDEDLCSRRAAEVWCVSTTPRSCLL